MTVEDPRQRIARILRYIEEKMIASANQLAVELNMPKYFVLAALNTLEAVGAIRLVRRYGLMKIYTITDNGRRLLEALKKNKPIRIVVEG